VYVNNLRLYREMLARRGVGQGPHFQTTTLDFLDDAAGQKWAALTRALNGTLEAWLTPQVDAIRRGDPTRPITVDHVDPSWPSCQPTTCSILRACHRYPGANARLSAARSTWSGRYNAPTLASLPVE